MLVYEHNKLNYFNDFYITKEKKCEDMLEKRVVVQCKRARRREGKREKEREKGRERHAVRESEMYCYHEPRFSLLYCHYNG